MHVNKHLCSVSLVLPQWIIFCTRVIWGREGASRGSASQGCWFFTNIYVTDLTVLDLNNKKSQQKLSCGTTAQWRSTTCTQLKERRLNERLSKYAYTWPCSEFRKHRMSLGGIPTQKNHYYFAQVWDFSLLCIISYWVCPYKKWVDSGCWHLSIILQFRFSATFNGPNQITVNCR